MDDWPDIPDSKFLKAWAEVFPLFVIAFLLSILIWAIFTGELP